MRKAPLVLILGTALGCPPDSPDPFFPEGFEDAWPEVRDCRLSLEHNGNSIVVYAAPEAAQAYVDGVYPFEPGTVLVKRESRDGTCTELHGYTAIRRLEDGEAPDRLDWEWQGVSADRRVLDIDPDACAACHSGCTEGRDGTCADEMP